MTGRRLPDPDAEARLYERICPQCGKTFYCWFPSEWVYKSGVQYFCSWTCYREDEHHVPPHPGRKASAKAAAIREHRRRAAYCSQEEALEQTRQIIALKNTGITNVEIGRRLGLSTALVGNRLFKYGRGLGWVPLTKKEAGSIGGAARRRKRKKAAEKAAD